jgi:DNA-binding SARP family transcriptional activator
LEGNALLLRLRTLGSVAAYAEGHPGLLCTVTQPKRVALLVYLGCAEVRRRDTVLGVFWPDLDAKHAGAALSRALYYLRNRLGPDVIRSIGQGGLAVGENVWMDLCAFRDAVAQGRFEAALELYRGEFLEGLHFSKGREFDRWLERERRAAHLLAEDAAARLTASARESGCLREAVSWARRGSDLSPLSESAACSLAQLLADAGNRAEALSTLRECAARMRTEMDLEPSTMLTDMMDGIRSRSREA